MDDFIPFSSCGELSTTRNIYSEPRPGYKFKPRSTTISRTTQSVSSALSQRNDANKDDIARQLFVDDGNHEPPIIRLHNEIKAFYEDIQPTAEEYVMRDNVVQRITAAINRRWTAAKVEVFGSCLTGLYLPTSDIDLVVFGKWDHKPLHTIQDILTQAGICDQATSRVLDNASVPILKLTDKLTRVKVDIGVNMTGGMITAAVVQGYMKEFPAMAYLVSIIKQFLYQRDLNEVYIGGVGSYSIILLVVSFLQLQPRNEGRRSDVNYGVLLLEFFELYGINFNYYFDGISVRGRGRYIPKNIESRNQPTLYIEDPSSPGNDVARSSFNIVQVRSAFSHAYNTLNREVRSVVTRGRLLSCIIQLSSDVVEYRKWIQTKFSSNSKSDNGRSTKLVINDDSDCNDLNVVMTTNKTSKALSPPSKAESLLTPPTRGTKRHSDFREPGIKQQIKVTNK